MKNKTFEIMKSKWKLELQDTIPSEDNEWKYGESDSIRRIIRIASKDYEGNDADKHDMLVTLFHEIMHSILTEGMYEEESSNEPMIEWMAKCLADLKEQGVI